MQRSWRKARFLIACSALLAYLPGCGPSEVELKLIVTKQGSDTPEVELVFPGEEPRIELDAGVSYDLKLLGRLKGDRNFAKNADGLPFRVSFSHSGLDEETIVQSANELKEISVLGQPGNYVNGVFEASDDEPTRRVLTLAVKGVTPTLALEVVGRGSVMVDDEEFTAGTKILDFNVGAAPKLTITEPDAFLGWSGSCVAAAGVAPTDHELTLPLAQGAKIECKAEFLPEPVLLSVQLRSADGSTSPGRVTSVGTTVDGQSIDCTSTAQTCEVMTEQTTDLQLIVETNDDFIFEGWSDEACGSLVDPGQKNISDDLACTAMFRPTCQQSRVHVPQGSLAQDGMTDIPSMTSKTYVQIGTEMDRPLAVEYRLYDATEAPTEYRTVPLGEPDVILSFEAEHPIFPRHEYKLQVKITHDVCGTAAEDVTFVEVPLRGV